MLSAKCPGQDRRNWKPEDIFDHECPHCGEEMEFFKTDAKRNCPECGEPVLNPRFNLGCALWCSFAEHCVGDISGVFTDRPEALRDKLEVEVRRYFYGAKKRLQYSLEAADVAARVLEAEKEAEPPVVISALLLHDVGYTSCAETQEIEKQNEGLQDCIAEKSREIAASILKDLKLPDPVRDEILEIVSGSASETETNKDVNKQLFEDTLEIARIKIDEYDRNINGEKEKLLDRLHRESSRKYIREEL